MLLLFPFDWRYRPLLEDTFVELCYKRDNKKYRILFGIFASIALLIVIFFLNYVPILFGKNIIFITGMISFGLIYLLYRILRNMNWEYEIELSNDVFDVARIIAGRKREELASFSVKDCEYLGPVTSDRYDRDCGNSVFVLNVTPDSNIEIDDKNWYAFVSQQGEKYIIAFTFKDEMYPVFRRYNPRNTAPYTPNLPES